MFSKSYIITGNKHEQVKPAGNAVTRQPQETLFIMAALSLSGAETLLAACSG